MNWVFDKQIAKTEYQGDEEERGTVRSGWTAGTATTSLDSGPGTLLVESPGAWVLDLGLSWGSSSAHGPRGPWERPREGRMGRACSEPPEVPPLQVGGGAGQRPGLRSLGSEDQRGEGWWGTG